MMPGLSKDIQRHACHHSSPIMQITRSDKWYPSATSQSVRWTVSLVIVDAKFNRPYTKPMVGGSGLPGNAVEVQQQ